MPTPSMNVSSPHQGPWVTGRRPFIKKAAITTTGWEGVENSDLFCQPEGKRVKNASNSCKHSSYMHSTLAPGWDVHSMHTHWHSTNFHRCPSATFTCGAFLCNDISCYLVIPVISPHVQSGGQDSVCRDWMLMQPIGQWMEPSLFCLQYQQFDLNCHATMLLAQKTSNWKRWKQQILPCW